MQTINRALSLLLVLLMLLSVFPMGILAEDAVQSEITIRFAAQKDGEFLFPQGEITVTDGIAEAYGYTVAAADHNDVAVADPTVFDALVAVHEALYGDAFTKESAADYLALEGGMLKTAFGAPASATGFFVNGEFANDGIDGTYGTTGYLVDTARLAEDDLIEFWFYQDTTYWSDFYTYFTESEKTVTAGEDFTLTLEGFMVLSAMGYTPSADVVNGEDGYITLHTVNADGSLSAALTDSEGEELLLDGEGEVTLSFAEPGEYILTASGFEGDYESSILAPWCKITVEKPLPAPTSITIVCEDDRAINATTLLTKTGDVFTFKALDQDGNETPVTWSTTSSWTGTMDAESGVFTTTATFSSGGTSYANIKAVSKLDTSISKQTNFSLAGYMFSDYQKAPTVALSEDGQTAKTVTVSGGYNGHTLWTVEGADGIAKLSDGQDLADKKTSLKFDALRPGNFTVTFTLDLNENMTDTATVTITGVAVEDADGNTAKTYLTKTSEMPEPTVQLLAYTADGEAVTWSSADETIAMVDENGVVTAKGVGSVLVTAADTDGAKGGIKVVVQDADTPYFEDLQFLGSAIKNYAKEYSFAPTVTDYTFAIGSYGTTKLTLQNTTLYNTEKFTATAEYTDIDGLPQTVTVQNGEITYLEGIPFGDFEVQITLADKADAENKTVYTFHVTRPRDTTKTLKNSTGAMLVPEGRSLSPTLYKDKAEGTMFKLTDDGEFKISYGTTLDTGISATHYLYQCFAYDGSERFSLSLAGTTVYTHLRYSTDGGVTFTELAQGGGKTSLLGFTDGKAEILVEVLDDATYASNLAAGLDGFADALPNRYTIRVEQISLSAGDAQIVSAACDGDWYPAFASDKYTYTVVVPAGTTSAVLTYTCTEGATVLLGTAAQTPDADGNYTLTLKTSAQTLTVTSADGSVTNKYSFKLQTKKANYPDKVLDYLCINSQYTNGSYGTSPWSTLSGSMVSLGNFGGYITYYYADGLTNNPCNKYGMDFYVYGNANRDTSTATGTSFFEPAQVWVSEDGETWYALAGSAHYEDGVDWEYAVEYTQAANGKTAWTDSHGNTNDGKSYTGAFPSADIYGAAVADSITLRGIALPARNGNLAVSGTATDAFPIRWGYADCFANGTIGADINPYLDNSDFSLSANGFDLEWAVDANGIPVDVTGKTFHYVKLQTASNIWHPSFGEKSPEIAGMLRTAAQAETVGRTAAPESIRITDGAETRTVKITDEQVYTVALGDMKHVSISVVGADAEDNIYINNERIAQDGAADGFKITKEGGERLIRVLLQNGDKEPRIYLLRLTSDAVGSDDLIEGIKLNVSGSTRVAETKDGKTYTASVGYRISAVDIVPVADPTVEITVNDAAPQESYTLQEGKNIFTIVGTKDGITHSVTLQITRDAAPTSTGTIRVYFTLLGDTAHGEDGAVHTLKEGGLTTWISKTTFELDAPATVLDLLEKALAGKYEFTNADGNYISEIGGLSEFDNGANSGWMYTVGKKHSTKGVAEQTLKNGDAVVFHYTDDYTKEQGSEGWESTGSSSDSKKEATAPAAAEKLIAAIGNVTVDSGAAIAAAREAYDKLSASEKKKVTNYETLLAAEKAFAELTKEEDPQAGAVLDRFIDIDDHWATDAISFVVQKGLFAGTSETTFAPEAQMTRAMIVTVLWRLAGQPTATGDSAFSDVAADAYYANAIAWATEKGIVNGYGNDLFGADDPVTREQLTALLYRYAIWKKYDADSTTDLSAYTDAATLSPFAVEAMQWAVASGLVNGRTETMLVPRGVSTRAEVATLLWRFVEIAEN